MYRAMKRIQRLKSVVKSARLLHKIEILEIANVVVSSSIYNHVVLIYVNVERVIQTIE